MYLLRHYSDEENQCIEETTRCSIICRETIQHCLEKGRTYSYPIPIKTLMDCAELCQMTTQFLLNRSSFQERSCLFCAEVCDVCEKNCNQLAEDPQLQACAEACARCSEVCRMMGIRADIAA
jgi:hypothetical protein